MPVRTQESHLLSLTDDISLGKSNCLNGTYESQDYCSYLKQKQSQAVQIYEKLKRKSRRRPLTKLMEDTSRVVMPSFCDWNAIAGQLSLEGVKQNYKWASKFTKVKQRNYVPLTDNSSDCSGTLCEETSLDASTDACNEFDDGPHSHSELNVNECPSRTETTDTDCSEGNVNVPRNMRESRIAVGVMVLMPLHI